MGKGEEAPTFYDDLQVTLEDLESVDECPVCGSFRFVDQGDVAGGRDFNWCLGCGLYFMNPRPTERFLNRFYGSEYWRATNSSTGALSRLLGQIERSSVFLRLLSKMNLTTLEGRILEIGSGMGGVVWSMSSALGLSPYANEPDRVSQRFLEFLDVKTVDDENLDSGSLDQAFSFVVLSHVLEHQTFPKQFLERAIRLLSPGGVLLIEVPNGTVDHNGGIEHPVVFSRNALRALLDQFGIQYRLTTHAGRGRSIRPPQYLVAVLQNYPFPARSSRSFPRLSVLASRVGRVCSPVIRRSGFFLNLEKLLGRKVRTSDEKTVARLRLNLIEKLFGKVTDLG